MLIGIVADSHDNLPKLFKAVEIFNQKKVELVLHAGDFVSPFTARPLGELKCPLKAVFGNNDGDKLLLKEEFRDIGEIHSDSYEQEVEGKKLILVHKEGLVNPLAKSNLYDIIIYGHTHKPDIQEGKSLIINPGECGGWLSGKSTVAILNTERMRAEMVTI